MLNVSKYITHPHFVQDFVIVRNTGSWTLGRFITSTVDVNISGVIVPHNVRDIIQTPDGDLIKGDIDVYTVDIIYTTAVQGDIPDGHNRISDEVMWRGEHYKVMTVQNFADYGYYHAVAVRKLGA